MSEIVKENEAVVEATPQTESIEQLKLELELVEAQEALLLEKIAESKKLGLLVQTEQLRELLRRCLATKARINRTIMDIEVVARTIDLNNVASEVDEVLNSEAVEAALITEEEERPAALQKARKQALGYRIASRIIGYVGVLACLLGSLAYLLMTQVETMNLPFDVLYLAIAGGAALFFLLIAVILGAKARDCKRKVSEIEEARLIRLIEQSEATEFAQIEAESIGAAQVVEAESEAAAIAAAAPQRKDAKTVAKELVVKVKTKAKENPKKTAKIAAACAAGVALATLVAVKSQKKSTGKTVTFKLD